MKLHWLTVNYSVHTPDLVRLHTDGFSFINILENPCFAFHSDCRLELKRLLDEGKIG